MSAEAPVVPGVPENTTEAKEAVTKKTTRAPLPQLTPPDGGFKEIPAEWNANTYAPLKKKDFSNPILYHEWKIQLLQSEMEKHTSQIKMYQQFGTDEASMKKAKAVNKSIHTLQNLAKELPEGINLKDLLGDLLSGLPAGVVG
jgi:hypothetical protein